MTFHPSPFAPHGFFVTGTDTGVGKTLMACALLHAFAARGARVVGMKPVAAGARRTARGLRNDDVDRLVAAGNVTAPLAWINPYCFEPPVAPHIAACAAGVAIELPRIANACRELAAIADTVIVEGAGGFCVPLNARETTADLAQSLGLPLLLVVGMRLGCLNHALLTAQAARARGLVLAGWVANQIEPGMPYLDENIAALEERLVAPCLAHVGFAPAADARQVARLLDLGALQGGGR
ncbi:MAG: dethiobiotin synthase [Burkholderiales bacterium]